MTAGGPGPWTAPGFETWRRRGSGGCIAVSGLCVAADLLPRVLGCGDVQAVGPPAVSWMGVAGLPEEAVPADADGAVNGDPHGVDLGEGISQVLRSHSAHCSEWLHQESVSESLCPSRSVPPGLFSLGTLDQEANPWSWSHNCETSWVTIVGAGRTGRKLRPRYCSPVVERRIERSESRPEGRSSSRCPHGGRCTPSIGVDECIWGVRK
jgi:hypothetical protein